jgi:hypothetical protein
MSVTFAFLAFRAVRMGKAPDRCYRVVWGAAVASATVNFAYEYTQSGHNLIAGGLQSNVCSYILMASGSRPRMVADL